jgi:hypothetical protein
MPKKMSNQISYKYSKPVPISTNVASHKNTVKAQK